MCILLYTHIHAYLLQEIEDVRAQLQQSQQEFISLQTTLFETRRTLHETASYPTLLQHRLAMECEARALVGRNLLNLEQVHSELERKHQECLKVRFVFIVRGHVEGRGGGGLSTILQHAIASFPVSTPSFFSHVVKKAACFFYNM